MGQRKPAPGRLPGEWPVPEKVKKKKVKKERYIGKGSREKMEREGGQEELWKKKVC